MLKKLFHKRTQVTALLLFLLCIFTFSLNSFAQSIMIAKAEGEIYSEISNVELDEGTYVLKEGEANKYLTYPSVTDKYIEELEQDVEMEYYEYITFYSSELEFDFRNFKRIYGDNFLDENYPIDESMYGEEELFEISTLRMINKNITAMNELVKEDIGYINDSYEFVFFDDYIELWALWNFSLKWNKLTLFMDSDAAIMWSLIVLGLRTIFHGYNIKSTMASLSDDGALVAIVQECCLVLPSDLMSGFVGLFTDPVISILANSFSIILTMAGNANVFIKALQIVVSIVLPSIVDGVVVLYNACKYDKGIELKLCWIPTWKDKWGLSIKSF